MRVTGLAIVVAPLVAMTLGCGSDDATAGHPPTDAAFDPAAPGCGSPHDAARKRAGRDAGAPDPPFRIDARIVTSPTELPAGTPLRVTFCFVHPPAPGATAALRATATGGATLVSGIPAAGTSVSPGRRDLVAVEFALPASGEGYVTVAVNVSGSFTEDRRAFVATPSGARLGRHLDELTGRADRDGPDSVPTLRKVN